MRLYYLVSLNQLEAFLSVENVKTVNDVEKLHFRSVVGVRAPPAGRNTVNTSNTAADHWKLKGNKDCFLQILSLEKHQVWDYICVGIKCLRKPLLWFHMTK